MKLFFPSAALLVLAACQTSARAPRALLAEPSGLERVSLLAKGLE